MKYHHSKKNSGEDTSFTWTILFTEEEVEKFIHFIHGRFIVHLRRVVNRLPGWLRKDLCLEIQVEEGLIAT